MKKSTELLKQKNQMVTEAKALLEAGKKDEARAKMKEIEDLNDTIELQAKLEEQEKEELVPPIAALPKKDKEDSAGNKFINSMKTKFTKFTDGLKEGTDEDGGYIVPEDISTEVRNYLEAHESLLPLVSYEKVSTNKGSDTYQKRSQQKGFQKIEEGADVKETETPKYERLSWEIETYGGFFPVTNLILADTTENIKNKLVTWLGNEGNATYNAIIMSLLKSKAETKIEGLDGLRTILNVVLGSLYKPHSIIMTNDDGMNYFDLLKDANGRTLLQQDITAPANYQLRAGANVIPIKTISNDFLATAENKIPLFVGDFKEGITIFDRQQLTVGISDTASVGNLNAFAQNLTLFKGLMRLDGKVKDAKAFVNGYIDISTPASK